METRVKMMTDSSRSHKIHKIEQSRGSGFNALVVPCAEVIILCEISGGGTIWYPSSFC
jgi:hypothetical protein